MRGKYKILGISYLNIYKEEYFLTAKNQGSDYDKNNQYFVAYSGIISHYTGRFNSLENYFPVGFGFLVALPDDEYLVSTNQGILGNGVCQVSCRI